MHTEDALKRFSASRLALLNAIAGLSDAELTGPKVEGVWNVKDLLGHIAAWETTLLEPLRYFAAGAPFQAQVISDHDAWNLEQSSRRSSWVSIEILKDLEKTRQELLTEVGKCSHDQLNQAYLAPWGDKNTIIEMISGLAWHEEEHTKSIRKFFPK